MSAWARIAQVVRTRNDKGSVVCRKADGLPFLLHAGLEVHFVPPALNAPRTAQVASVVSAGPDAWHVEFAGVDGEQAALLAGMYCLAARSDLDADALEASAPSCIGYAVRDRCFGLLGQVADLLEVPGQATLVVAGSSGELLVPLVDQYVENVDDGASCVYTQVSAGLMNLAREGGFEPAAAQGKECAL